MDNEHIYHYYNRKYSETGIVTDNIDKVFKLLARDFVNGSDINVIKEVKDDLEKRNEYGTFHLRITKTKLIGDVDKYYGYLFILRYPYGVYVSDSQCYYDGLKHDVTNKETLEKIEKCKNDTEELIKLWKKHHKYSSHIEDIEEWKVDISFLSSKE